MPSRNSKNDSNMELTEAHKILIEKLGVMHEKSGMAPAPSRVMSLLLVSPITELTFDEIREALSLSKSAASSAINSLLSANKIDYITKPGDRKRYFRSNVIYWEDQVKQNYKGLDLVADMLEEVLNQRPGNTVDFNNSLSEVVHFLRYLITEMPKVYAKWEESRR